MFAHARRRLTLIYIAMFSAVILVFSVAFLALLAVVLQPDYDVAPDTSSQQAAQIAYDAAVERVGLALLAADLIAIVVVGGAAWVVAARTLGPIRAAHERQQRFVADASHEMRTPLTAIRTTTDNALLAGTEPADQRAALETVSTAAAELATLTSDLLTLAQGDDPRLMANPQKFDLSVAVAERVSLRAAAHAPKPTVALAADLLATGRPEDIGRICDNLIDNAFRYGGPMVNVVVRTWAADRSVVLEVADDGPGIAQADQERIFEPFYRVHADASAPAGTGLGLAIGSSLARRNGGRLVVDSRPGRRTQFRLYLPRAT